MQVQLIRYEGPQWLVEPIGEHLEGEAATDELRGTVIEVVEATVQGWDPYTTILSADDGREVRHYLAVPDRDIPKEPLERHPHMQQCPHCGSTPARVRIERDALEISMIEWQRGEMALGPQEVSLLDNTEVYFDCCHTQARDAALVEALVDLVYG